MGIEAEMRRAAFVVGQRRIDRRNVEEQHGLLRIALVMLGHEFVQRAGGGRGISGDENADAGIDGLLRLDDGLLRIQLVVETGDLVARLFAAQALAHDAQVVQRILGDGGGRSRQRIDEGDAHGNLCISGSGGGRKKHSGNGENTHQGPQHGEAGRKVRKTRCDTRCRLEE
jgi:hypothetical protein